MKAYYLTIKDDYEGSMELVFADTAKEAKKKVWGTYLADSLENYIDLRVNRAKSYDGMEKLSKAEISMQQWRDGWRWFDYEAPDPDTATDQEFLDWYKANFERGK